MTDVVCLGILVADAIVRPTDVLPERGTVGLVDSIELHGGGSALSTASVLAKLGLATAVLGKVGADPFGDFLISLCRDRGVDAAGVVRAPGERTSASVALVESGGERTFLHSPGANSSLTADDFGERPYAGRALHVAGALVLEALDGEPMARLLREARRRGIQTSLDTTFDPTGRWERVVRVLPGCDLVTPGLAEASAITGEPDPGRAAARLRELGARVAAVTLGEDGCYVAADELTRHVPGFAVDAVDGTGAGDAFAACFVYGLLAGWPLEWCARFANAGGALAVTAVGAFDGVGDLEATLRFTDSGERPGWR